MKKTMVAAICGMMGLVALAGGETLKVDKSRSRIQVDAKATGHAFTATLNDYNAKVSGNASSLKPTALELKWKFSDLKTEDTKRDEEMIKWLGGASPAGSFRFIKTWTDGGKDYAQGTITIHGVSKTIAFPFSARKDGRWVTIDGQARLNYKDFALPIIRAMAVMTVKPQLTVRFHLVGKI